MDYSELVDTYKQLDSTTKRLEKTFYIAELLRDAKTEDLSTLILLLQGRLFPVWDERKTGVSTKLVLKAIAISTGRSPEKIMADWKKTGDLGHVAENMVEKKKQATLFSEKLTVKKVFDNLTKLAGLEGPGTVDQKVKLIAQLLTSATGPEARFITRTVLEDLRVGVGSGTLRDAIVQAYLPKVSGIAYHCSCGKWIQQAGNCIACEDKIPKKFKDVIDSNSEKVEKDKLIEIDSLETFKKLLQERDFTSEDILVTPDEKVARQIYNELSELTRRSYDLTNDFSKVAIEAKDNHIKGLMAVPLKVGNPLNLMLYKKAKGIEDGFNQVGKPAALEYKYDGFRMEIHRDGDEIKLFTRRLEDVSHQFPDVKKAILEHIDSKDFIIDAEIVGLDKKTRKYLPFQHISKRIRRKHRIDEMIKEIPVVINIFDAIEIDGDNLLDEAFQTRRDRLKGIVNEKDTIISLAKQLITDSDEEAQKFYQEALDMGNEGIMMKNLDGIYKPGSRVGYGVKVKPVMETLDLTIVGAEWGEGKRKGWFTSFLVACIDDQGQFLEIGKVGTGIKELKESEGVTFDELTELLKPLILKEKGKEVWVKPGVVVEIHYEEIQKSPTYSSGYALRFPRIVRLREDRSPHEVSDLDLVDDLFHSQN